MTDEDQLDRAIGDWLEQKEIDPELLPGAFAARLPPSLASAFLLELEALAQIDGLATLGPPRDLPRRFGDYRVLGELGSGAMGAVYDAEQVSTGRRVALKVMHPHVAHDLRSAARFAREARTAAALVHPGIVAVLDFGESDGAAWLAMPRVQGCSLQRLLWAVGDPRDVDHQRAIALLRTPRRLARAIADVADALEFAHRHNVVHRDVKPANLMIADDGRVVVLDLGLASSVDHEGSTLTRAGDFLGTPVYMAPEQAMGAQNGTALSDVYSLGAVLYECLTGRTPVAAGPLATVLDAILHRDPVDPRRLVPGVPEELARIALQCLDKEPSRRYPTAAAVADDLRRFVDQKPVRARHHGAMQRSWRRIRQRPAMATMAATAVLLASIAAVFWLQAERGQAKVRLLQRDRDLAAMTTQLASAPERITVFGGASLRHYARLGLGAQLPAGSGARSAQASAALAIGERLLNEFPEDLAVQRTVAEALFDIGDDPERVDAMLTQLLRHPDASAGDRAMAAVWRRQRGDEAGAQRLRATVSGSSGQNTAGNDAADNDAEVNYWLGFWHQAEQDHAAAVKAFTRALSSPELPSERRYFALLHRGWCFSCPDVCRLRAAQDDLTQAAALRPAYGTAKLLWAALHCLEPEPDLGRAVGTVQEVLTNAEPWLHVLTARVLQALAEGGTWQAGPVSFGAEFSPIAIVPIGADRAAALAGLSLQLLDGLLSKQPELFEAAFHRVTSLALLGRHEEALVQVERLLAVATGQQRAPLWLQQARVQLAAGRSQLARDASQRALAADASFVAAWRFRAVVAAHVGDLTDELLALTSAVNVLATAPIDVAVYPDAMVLLPELQLRRARVLASLGRDPEALAVLQGPLGGLLHGEASPRIQLQIASLRSQLGAAQVTPAFPLLEGSPLRWLADASLPVVADVAAASAVLHGWMPNERLAPAWPGVDAMLQSRGQQAPRDPQSAALSAVLPNTLRLLQDASVAPVLLSRAEQLIAQDPEHSEARLLHAMVLYATARADAASGQLAATVERFSDDLRGRFLQAAAAMAVGEVGNLRQALQREQELLSAAQLDAAGALLRLPVPPSGEALLSAMQ